MTTTYNYLCCGVPENPFDDIFGCGATRDVSQDKTVSDQTWTDPFSQAPAVPVLVDSRSVVSGASGQVRQSAQSVDGRSVASGVSGVTGASGVSGVTGVSSTPSQQTIGTATYRSREGVKTRKTTGRLGKSLLDIEREQKARKKALELSENLDVSGKVKGGGKVTSILKTWANIKKTETTRTKKEATPDDVHDPESISGMKSREDNQLEDCAKKKSSLMISNGKFPYDENASHVAQYCTAAGYRHPPTKEGDKRVGPIV